MTSRSKYDHVTPLLKKLNWLQRETQLYSETQLIRPPLSQENVFVLTGGGTRINAVKLPNDIKPFQVIL